MGREVRRVPADWQHPKDKAGQFIPLFEGHKFAEWLSDWEKGAAQWENGRARSYGPEAGADGYGPINEKYRGMKYEEYAGEKPDRESFMPAWPPEQCTHCMMYEDTTEGTPISPAFATPEELARWLADTGASAFGDMKADYEHWLSVARGGWAPGLVISGGVMQSGVQAAK